MFIIINICKNWLINSNSNFGYNTYLSTYIEVIFLCKYEAYKGKYPLITTLTTATGFIDTNIIKLLFQSINPMKLSYHFIIICIVS